MKKNFLFLLILFLSNFAFSQDIMFFEIEGNSEIYSVDLAPGVTAKSNAFLQEEDLVNKQLLDNDIVLMDARMNFFQYVDYTQPGYAGYYHYSSYYGNVAAEQYNSSASLSSFNISVKNNGSSSVTPIATVVVFDPDMNEIYTKSVTGNALSAAAVDTIDITSGILSLGPNVDVGMYTVVYSVSVDGQTDPSPEDNSETSYFNINNSSFGRDFESTEGSVSPQMWTSGGNDTEQIGVPFFFLYETEITSIDVFVKESTSSGTAIIGNILQYDSSSSQWVTIGSSSFVNLTDDNIGDWVNIELADIVNVNIPNGSSSALIMASIEFYYNGASNVIDLGYDPDVQASSWGTKWYFTSGPNAYNWISIASWSGGVNIRLNVPVCVVESFDEAEICEGEVYNWHGTDYTSAGNYNVSSSNGDLCDSVFNLNLGVYSFPSQVDMVNEPEDLVLDEGFLGTIGLVDSYVNTFYWVSMDGIPYTEEVNGDGEAITFGTEFPVGTFEIWSRNTGGCEFLQGTVTFTVGENGINLNQVAQDVDIFPNPAGSIVTISSENIKKIEIINLRGQITYVKECNSNTINIDLSNCAKGIYFVKVITSKGTKVEKLILE